MGMAGTIAGVGKKKPSSGRGSAGKAVIYLEVDPALKGLMEELAREQNRRLTGQCIQALQEHLAKHGRWPPSEEKPP